MLCYNPVRVRVSDPGPFGFSEIRINENKKIFPLLGFISALSDSLKSASMKTLWRRSYLQWHQSFGFSEIRINENPKKLINPYSHKNSFGFSEIRINENSSQLHFTHVLLQLSDSLKSASMKTLDPTPRALLISVFRILWNPHQWKLKLHPHPQYLLRLSDSLKSASMKTIPRSHGGSKV